MVIQHEQWISIEDYHTIERTSEIKYEYSDGRLYAMSGGTAEHSRIALNIAFKLNDHLRNKPCKIFNSDMKVLPLGNENPSYYPDLTVTCHPEDYRDDSTAIRSPRLVVEVLSPSTAFKDRGEKLLVYQSCPSIEEYVIISTQRQQVDVYHREDTNEWRLRRYTAEQAVQLESIGLILPIADIYVDTEVPSIGSVLSAD